ncbi:MAG: glycosyltransferase family 4 protein [Gemmatimonadales bacterium]
MKPTYVIVAPWPPTYGSGINEVVLNSYRETLTAGAMQPLLLVIDWSAARPVETLTGGCRTVLLRLASPWPQGKGWMRSLLGVVRWLVAAPLALTDLVRFCRRHRIVAFNFYFPSLNAFSVAVLRCLRLYRGALILSFQGLDVRDAAGGGRVTRALWRFVLRYATAVVACSRAFAADVSRFVGNDGRVVTIHNGVDIPGLLSNVDRTAAVPALVRERPFILSVATFEHKKGLDVLLRAFAEVRRRHRGLALVLVGRTHAAAEGLRALARELDVADDVLFCADRPHAQVGLFLERAKVFCLPSRAEPFGIAILEAGAYRVPVVASRVGGIPELLADGDTGLLVDPDDAGALATALNRVLDDGELARTLAERFHQRVAETFSWRRAHEAYAALVPALDSGSPPQGAQGP